MKNNYSEHFADYAVTYHFFTAKFHVRLKVSESRISLPDSNQAIQKRDSDDRRQNHEES